MRERSKRPSRLLQAIARWALTLGAAGTVVGATALYGVLVRNEVVSGKRNLLLLSALLLAAAFMLAPVVRRAFSRPGPVSSKRPAHRTLLDEMREGAHTESGADSAESIARTADAVSKEPEAEEPDAPASLTARVMTVAYVIFAAMLLAILWSLQAT